MARKTRRHPRVRTAKLVASIDAPAERFTGCAVQNLSMGGMLVRTGGRIPDGSPVTVELVGPGMRKSIRLGALVVGFDPGVRGLRLQFQLESHEPRSRLSELLTSLGLKSSDEARPPPKEEAVAAPPEPAVAPPPRPPRAADSPPRVAPTPVPSIPPVARTQQAGDAAATRALPGRGVQPATSATANPAPAVDSPALQELQETNRRLMVQVKGLLLQLSDSQERVSSQQLEIEQLRAELAQRTSDSKGSRELPKADRPA